MLSLFDHLSLYVILNAITDDDELTVLEYLLDVGVWQLVIVKTSFHLLTCYYACTNINRITFSVSDSEESRQATYFNLSIVQITIVTYIVLGCSIGCYTRSAVVTLEEYLHVQAVFQTLLSRL